MINLKYILYIFVVFCFFNCCNNIIDKKDYMKLNFRDFFSDTLEYKTYNITTLTDVDLIKSEKNSIKTQWQLGEELFFIEYSDTVNPVIIYKNRKYHLDSLLNRKFKVPGFIEAHKFEFQSNLFYALEIDDFGGNHTRSNPIFFIIELMQGDSIKLVLNQMQADISGMKCLGFINSKDSLYYLNYTLYSDTIWLFEFSKNMCFNRTKYFLFLKDSLVGEDPMYEQFIDMRKSCWKQ
jgi:hypothetical protein